MVRLVDVSSASVELELLEFILLIDDVSNNVEEDNDWEVVITRVLLLLKELVELVDFNTVLEDEEDECVLKDDERELVLSSIISYTEMSVALPNPSSKNDMFIVRGSSFTETNVVVNSPCADPNPCAFPPRLTKVVALPESIAKL